MTLKSDRGGPSAGQGQILFAAAIGVVLLASGCASVPADMPPTAAPGVPAGWQAPLPGATTAAATATSDLVNWWQRFNDPALPPLIAAAQQASPTLASATPASSRRATLVAAGARCCRSWTAWPA